MSIKIPKLPGNRAEFLNSQLTFIDPKPINLDRTLVNLFVLLKHRGGRPRGRVRGSAGGAVIGVEDIQALLTDIEGKGLATGLLAYPEAVQGWLRANLLDIVNRGKTGKENVASLKPIHLLSYRIRNGTYSRDYKTSEQVYSFLSVRPQVRDELRQYLLEGWDLRNKGKGFSPKETPNVDTLGLLRLIQQSFPNNVRDSDDEDSTADAPAIFDRIRPLLMQEAELYCEDVHRLLQYQHVVPRHVLLDYLKTLTGFHLSLYLLKLVRYVPMMVRSGELATERPLDIVIDVTDDATSAVAELATQDATWFYNNLPDYVRAGHAINLALASLPISGASLDESELLRRAVKHISTASPEFMSRCTDRLRDITENPDITPELRQQVIDMVKLEDSDINGYLTVFMHRRGKYHLGFNTSLLDSLMQKGSESGLLAAGHSRKHKRRFVLGTRLLELLAQLSVLKADASQTHYTTVPVSIEDFTGYLHQRYGLLINGLDQPRFAESDLRTHQAFSQNMNSLKDKLRKIGFYTQLSDAYLLQKIRPRYTL
jgi:hypothetical protein